MLLPMETRGTRLRSFLLAQTGGKQLSAWMSDRAAMDLQSLDALAGALSVRPYQILAAMDGDAVVAVDAVLTVIDEAVERAVTARLGPRRQTSQRSVG